LRVKGLLTKKVKITLNSIAAKEYRAEKQILKNGLMNRGNYISSLNNNNNNNNNDNNNDNNAKEKLISLKELTKTLGHA